MYSRIHTLGCTPPGIYPSMATEPGLVNPPSCITAYVKSGKRWLCMTRRYANLLGGMAISQDAATSTVGKWERHRLTFKGQDWPMY